MRRLLFAIILCSIAFAVSANAMDYATSKAALVELKTAYPGIGLYSDGDRVTRVYGQPFGAGSNPANTAEQFRDHYAALFGTDPENLRPGSVLDQNHLVQPVMYNSETGEYKFTLVYYSQYIDDIPVYMADLRLLVRNESGYPLVLASSALRKLGDFSPGKIEINKAMAENAASGFNSELVSFDDPRMVVWAGIDNMKVRPALAMEIVAHNDKPATTEYEKWRLLVDAETGEILYSENMIMDVNVTGNVSGRATQGDGADICGPEDSTPLPYARVYIQGGNETYADANGDFEIINGGSSPVTVISQIKGDWFNVYNQAGGDALLSQSVTPPGPANFLHNSSNSGEYNRAEVNGYVHANIVRDFTLTYNPLFNTIWNQHNFPVNVNIADNCNAFYDYSSINFFTSGGGCANSAFSTVVHHEYGHHLVAVAGSGQGQYGEGMSDVMGILITDNPNLGYGFYNNCSQYMRTGDNNHQYPCSGGIHDCGQLISGCIWDTRNALAITYPDDYMDILANLTVNSILLHTGTQITPQITIDFLTLDDDDDNINNGTPHWNEICAGFGAHNMDCPELNLIGFNYPNGRPQNLDPDGGTAVRVEVYAVAGTPQPGTGMLYYNGGSGWVSVAMNVVSPNVYDAVFPAFPCGTVVNYYISAEATTGFEVVDPPGAPVNTYSSISATGFITVFSDDFSTDMGWTGYGGAAEWARGAATGGSGNDSYGGPDPAVDHSPTDDNYVLGNDLGAGSGGDYSADMGSTYWITSPSIDCSGLTGLTISFYRWLGIEQPAYDHAYFQVYNGSTWITLYENGVTEDEASWSERTYDVSAYANDNPDFRVRFGLGTTDVAWQYCGWNIDDLILWTYECGPQITGTLDGTVTDGANPISGVSVYADDGAGHTGTTTTAGDGTYTMDLIVSSYTVTYSHPSYESVILPGIVIFENTTTTQDVVMNPIPVPDIDISPTQITGAAPPEGIDTDIITISNFGTGTLDFSVSVSVYAPSPGLENPFSRDLPGSSILSLESEGNDIFGKIEKQPFTGVLNIPDPNVILQGGDNIGNATVISSLPFSDDGSTAGYSDDYDEVCNFPGSTSPDVVYAYTPSTNITVDISLCGGSDYDTKLYVYENSPGNLVDCNDDYCSTPNYPSPYVSSLEDLYLLSGQTYYFVIDGYGGDYGNYTIDVTGIPDLNWLSIDPAQGSIDPDDPPISVNVTMDATGLTPGTYIGNINVSSNDPDEPSVDVPVTFNVGTVQTGTLQGTVTNTDTDPISGATVFADDGIGNTGSATTNGSGFYTMDLIAGTYTVTFSASGYIDTVIPGVVITDGGTTVQDAVMELTAPVPALSEWGMIILSLLLLAVGTIAVVRRRRTLAAGTN